MSRKVWIVNRSSHDFSKAEKYGELRFLSKGLLRKRNVCHMARLFSEALLDSSPDDYIVPTSLSVMSTVAALCFMHRHGRVNLLIFEDDRYKPRTILFEQEQEKESENETC